MTEDQRLTKLRLKNEAQIESVKAAKEIVVSILNNPMVDLVLGVIALEYAERRQWTGPIITTATETGLIAVTTARALAPIVPQLAQAGANIAKLVPGL